VLQRESWQSISALKVSQADVASFCFELSKKLDIVYTSPALSANVTLIGQAQGTNSSESASPRNALDNVVTDSIDFSKVADMFEISNNKSKGS
jgi:hypothetical protein